MTIQNTKSESGPTIAILREASLPLTQIMFSVIYSTQISKHSSYIASSNRKSAALKPHEIAYLEAYKLAFQTTFSAQRGRRLDMAKSRLGWSQFKGYVSMCDKTPTADSPTSTTRESNSDDGEDAEGHGTSKKSIPYRYVRLRC